MKALDINSGIDALELVPGARTTTTGNGTGVDIRDYEGIATIILSVGAGGGTTPTLDIKIQDSADNSSFTDVTGKAFTQVTTTASKQTMSLDIDNVRRYVRAVKTVGGTSPTFDGSVVMVARKKFL